MQFSFRTKLFLIATTAALSVLFVLAASALIGSRKADALDDLEQHLLPKLELGPRLDAEFARLRQSFQDATTAQDKAALATAAEHKARLIELLTSSGGALEEGQAASLRWAFHEYYQLANDVSLRLIDGETGERLVEDIARMQKVQARATALIEQHTRIKKSELRESFETVRTNNRRADQLRVVIGGLSFFLVVVLSVTAGRSLLRSVAALSEGFSRFATGDFTRPIEIVDRHELGKVAKDANEMAANLKRMAEQRDRADWLKGGLAGLSDELRGELELSVIARRSLWFLARIVEAQAGALYLTNDDGVLELAAGYGLSDDPDPEAGSEGTTRRFSLGEGLVGQAATGEEMIVVDDPPPDYLKIRSGLGNSPPRTLILLPLAQLGKSVGVIELALLGPCTEDVREFLKSIRQTLVIAVAAARARAAERDLLARTQQQAERLAAQEEELKANNAELLVQQEELRVANEELEEQWKTLALQNKELTAARERLQQKAAELATVSSYKSQFLANMSHELRTPLNSMLLLSHLLAENESGNLTPKQVEHARTIHSAGQDLLALINQVLDLAKIEAGRQELHVETVELERFTSHAQRVFEPLAAERGLELVVEREQGLPERIDTDEQRVERILTNLLGNAVKFTERGKVELRVHRPAPDHVFGRADLSAASTIAFSVSDTGIGISQDALERVFAPFEQLESRANRRYGGTGLGLAIARESARLLGGELTVVSEVGKGSTFTLYLPEQGPREATAQPARPAVNGAGEKPLAAASGAGCLLIIEDDVTLAEQLEDIIRARRFDVLTATSGEEGLRLARERKPRGIILDVRLPDIDGWTVMERLRQDPETRSIPVHFVSGVDAPQRGLALGAVGYLLKPATRAELENVVRVLAPTAPARPQRILVVEDSAREAESLVEILSRENWSAEHVTSAGAALEALAARRFDCMILDLGLPDMDGLGLLEALRDREEIKPPRVIIHTGRTLSRKEAQLLETYAQAVVMKDGNSAERLLEEVRLFVRHIADQLPKSNRPKPVEPRAADVSLDGVKILLAEDDMRTVYALSALLRGKGATVLVADTGREALETLSSNPDVQAVLMDIMMPEMDGYEAIRRLREDRRFEKLPVIALTAKAMKGERERCLEVGASDYLTKPVDSDGLLATLKTWLPSGASHGSA